MAITTRNKIVYATSDGKEHATRLEATRYETRLTLEQLGFKQDTATRVVAMGVDTLRAVAQALNDYSDELVTLKKLAHREDAVGAWPADANVAPRPGDKGTPRRPASLDHDYSEDEGEFSRRKLDLLHGRGRKPEEVNDLGEDEDDS